VCVERRDHSSIKLVVRHFSYEYAWNISAVGAILTFISRRATILLCCLLSACGDSICLLSACGGSIVLCEKMQLFHDILSNFDQQRDRVVRS